MGVLIAVVTINDISIPSLSLLVIKEEGLNLIGKTWLKAYFFFWPTINMTSNVPKDDLINKFPDIFADDFRNN